jgi:hypothetical protein
MALVQVLLIRDVVPLCNGACIEFRPEGRSPPAGVVVEPLFLSVVGSTHWQSRSSATREKFFVTWCARRDSNPRPSASEADTLSS